MVCENFWKAAEKMDEDRKNGAEKLNLSHPFSLKGFLIYVFCLRCWTSFFFSYSCLLMVVGFLLIICSVPVS